MLGAMLKTEGPEFVVHRVVGGSAAEAAGLKPGDAIVAIDGKPSSELTLEQARRTFGVDGRSHALTVRSNGATRDVRVTLKRLL
jgi:C-terminal processing protease CtpA/Prc